jgi:hypothetical protein
MKIGLKHLNYIILPVAIGIAGYGTYKTIKDAENYKDVGDLKNEIKQKDPLRYDSLIHDGKHRVSYIDWQYEVNKMNDSIKADSMAKKAYFEGAQMVRDSIKKTERDK